MTTCFYCEEIYCGGRSVSHFYKRAVRQLLSSTELISITVGFFESPNGDIINGINIVHIMICFTRSPWCRHPNVNTLTGELALVVGFHSGGSEIKLLH